jgi:hypothetical protein
MKRSTALLAAFGTAAILTGAPAAFAQSGTLISVDISNVANNIAKNLSVNVSQIPVSVQVPVDIAANVCGVAANVLGTQAASGSGSCTAKTTTAALDQVVQSQIKKG